jgi:hypothetical protein
MQKSYYVKYIKYKNKYQELKNGGNILIGGSNHHKPKPKPNDEIKELFDKLKIQLAFINDLDNNNDPELNETDRPFINMQIGAIITNLQPLLTKLHININYNITFADLPAIIEQFNNAIKPVETY